MRHAFIQGAAALLALAPAPSLTAGDITFGAQAGIAFPTGSMRQNGFKTGGPSLGLHALVDLGGGHALRPRLEWTRLRGEPIAPIIVPDALLRIESTANTLALGADYLFHPQGRIEGLYLLAGLSLEAHHFSATITVDAHNGGAPARLAQAGASFSTVKPGVHVGLGWQFNRNLGLELRHGISHPGHNQAVVTGTLGAIPFQEAVMVDPGVLRKTTLSLVARF